jgi:hypothetical protein
MSDLLKNVATKQDIAEVFGIIRSDIRGASCLLGAMEKFQRDIFRWQLFFFVLNCLSTCIIFWWALK